MTLTVVPTKGVTTRNIDVNYESSISDHSKVMANVKVCFP